MTVGDFLASCTSSIDGHGGSRCSLPQPEISWKWQPMAWYETDKLPGTCSLDLDYGDSRINGFDKQVSSQRERESVRLHPRSGRRKGRTCAQFVAKMTQNHVFVL